LGMADVKQFENEYTKILIETLQQVENPFSFMSWVFPVLSPLLLKLQMAVGRTKGQGFMRLIEKVSRTVNERKQKRAQGERSDDRTDFIDLFLDAESSDVPQQTTGVYDKSNAQVRFNNLDLNTFMFKVTKRLTIDEVIGQLNIFLLA